MFSHDDLNLFLSQLEEHYEDDYRDVKKYKDEVSSILEEISVLKGYYVKQMGGNVEILMKLNRDCFILRRVDTLLEAHNMASSAFNYADSRMDIVKRDMQWMIEGGHIIYGSIHTGAFDYKLFPVDGGIRVETTQENTSGIYKKDSSEVSKMCF